MPELVTVTSFYTGLLAILFLIISIRAILGRRDARVSVGDGNDKVLRKKIRVQANFVEYAPFAVILLAMAELQGTRAMVLHILGLMLLSGRILHAIGLGHTPQIIPARRFGMYLTVGMIFLAALLNIWHAIF